MFEVGNYGRANKLDRRTAKEFYLLWGKVRRVMTNERDGSSRCETLMNSKHQDDDMNAGRERERVGIYPRTLFFIFLKPESLTFI